METLDTFFRGDHCNPEKVNSHKAEGGEEKGTKAEAPLGGADSVLPHHESCSVNICSIKIESDFLKKESEQEGNTDY